MYSQSSEEQAILDAVGDKTGTFIDIGAYDGKTFSNTLALVERGWSGVMVEPSLAGFSQLLDRHGSNPRITLVHGIVGHGAGLTGFWNTDDAVSTTQQGNYDRWKHSTRYQAKIIMAQIDRGEHRHGRHKRRPVSGVAV